jgi:hypothetical protein
MNLGPWLLVGLAALPSCGGRATGDSGSDSGPSEDAATTPSADVYAPCSSSPPADGACASPGLQCELGTSPFLVCDTYATCGNGVWSFEEAVPSLCAAATSACTVTPVEGAPCPQAALNTSGCDTAAGMQCECGSSQTTATWQCIPHGQAGCPPVRPRLGAPCTLDAGSQCDYAGVDVMECTAAGVWIMRINP